MQLAENASVEQIADKVYDYMKKVNPESGTKFILQPAADIHLRSDYAIDLYGSTESKALYVYVFSAVALFVLLIACINFMNLSTARSEKRAREIGLRKVVGANRSSIITQFYGESLFVTLISFLIAVLLVFLLLPVFNNLSGKSLTIASLAEPVYLLGLLGILLITGLVSGSYPALLLSSYTPVHTIKSGSLLPSAKTGKSIFRRVLVILQFTLSIMLIVGTITVYTQINFILSKKLGYEKDSIIYFIKRANIRTQYEAFKTELLSDPNIVSVTSSSDIPTYTVHSTTAFSWQGKNPETHFLIHQFSIDHDYIKTFNMNIIAGRDFSKAFPVDDSTQTFIVNETAVAAMNLEKPVGTEFLLYRNSGRIIGVVEDFHFKSLQTTIEPLVMRIEPERDSYVFVKFKKERTRETIDTVQQVYDVFNPDHPLEYSFLHESVERLYDAEQRTKKIFNFFTFIAVIISCLGLYGLAAYMAQRRTKEIGVRKVLGASITRIVGDLSKEFIVLVSLANIIAWPIAYFAMETWLRDFAYRISINPLIFIFAGVLSILLGLITVSHQSIRAASNNPVDALKYE